MMEENCDFNDWQWQIKNSIKNLSQLNKMLPNNEARELWQIDNFSSQPLPFSVTPYFASLMTGEFDCPIFAQVISSKAELLEEVVDMQDPLGEEERKKVPHLVHRYPDRVLFLATDRCAAYCRFCTRKRWVGQGPSPKKDEQEQAFQYIENNSQIKEIIFSGGDPLLLSNDRIRYLIERAFRISNIEVVRFHTRMLSFAPMRINLELKNIFAQNSPIYIVTHFNHPKEITEHTVRAINLLIESGVILLNQSVLLKNINDNKDTLTELFRTLVRYRIKPYYLHQCDVIKGSQHFRVPVKRALDLMQQLRGHISGLCLPTLVVDIPGGHGKVPLTQSAIVDEDDQYIYLRGFLGKVARYPK